MFATRYYGLLTVDDPDDCFGNNSGLTRHFQLLRSSPAFHLDCRAAHGIPGTMSEPKDLLLLVWVHGWVRELEATG